MQEEMRVEELGSPRVCACALAEVYLSMTRGQESLLMDMGESASPLLDSAFSTAGVELIVVRATPDELVEHRRQLDDIDKAAKGACAWKKLDQTAEAGEALVGGTGIEPVAPAV